MKPNRHERAGIGRLTINSRCTLTVPLRDTYDRQICEVDAISFEGVTRASVLTHRSPHSIQILPFGVSHLLPHLTESVCWVTMRVLYPSDHPAFVCPARLDFKCSISR